jgi:hypothetical protein
VLHHKVLKWERVATSKRYFRALRIELTAPGQEGFWVERTIYYFYAPAAKAIMQFHWPEQYTARTVRLVDFRVSRIQRSVTATNQLQ